MSGHIDNSGPAFPYEERNREGAPYKDYFGMTLRDYFAAKAMLAVMSRPEFNRHSMKDLACGAYKTADAMLEARAE